MAKCVVAVEVVETALFGFSESEVTITGVSFDPEDGVMIFDIIGSDIPQCEFVSANISTQRNRAGEQFRRMEFLVAKK